ncbi:hypothetical protein [Egibacter rhizosphaerae]|nr:hypothetical protein [Egibacter rhizosphaerae]
MDIGTPQQQTIRRSVLTTIDPPALEPLPEHPRDTADGEASQPAVEAR